MRISDSKPTKYGFEDLSMSAHQPSAALSRPIEAGGIPPEGVKGSIEADSGEREELARRLELAALDTLALSYELVPAGRGRFRLTGRWHAEAAQTCGVTLEPITRSLDENLSIEFWSPEVWARHIRENGEIAIAALEETPELIEHGIIDPGHLLEELLIVSLPPFPRREDAELDWRETVTRPESPFAVLKSHPKNSSNTP